MPTWTPGAGAADVVSQGEIFVMLGWRRERSYEYATQRIDPARAIIPRFLNLPTELEEVTLNAWTPEQDRSSLDLPPKKRR